MWLYERERMHNYVQNINSELESVHKGHTEFTDQLTLSIEH